MPAFRSLFLLATLSFVLAACAMPNAGTTAAIDWNRPLAPATTPPAFNRDLAITNPPSPLSLDEPARFEFRRQSPTPKKDPTTDRPVINIPGIPRLADGIL